MADYILAIDQGTTTTTVILVNAAMELCGKVSIEFPQYYPKPGWVEHNLEEIWQATCAAMEKVLQKTGISGEQIAAIGITNQRETTGLWHRDSGKPLYNAIVWQCRRTASICRDLMARGCENLFSTRTGLVLDPYFSGTKLGWLLDNIPGARDLARRGKLCFGTIDTFLLYRLSGGAVHITDVTNASRTLMFDINKLSWDPELVDLVGAESETLPEVKSSSEIYGYTKGLSCLPDGIPISGIAGDQQAALFGQACFKAGMVKATYGTGSFILMNTGKKAVASSHGLLTTIGWKIGDDVTYALEGSAFIAGAMVQWLRDGLKVINSAPEIEALAASVADSEGVVVVPSLSGLGAPYWRPEARGIITGITRGTTAAHIARAALEGLALQNHDLISAMAMDASEALNIIRVDGGASANNLLMQLQADILQVPVSRPQIIETTALGAAVLAGLAVGFYDSLEQVANTWHEERRFEPQATRQWVSDKLRSWQKAVTCA